jgi:hypothetical protein
MGFAVRADVIGISATAAVFVSGMLAALVAGQAASGLLAFACQSCAKGAAARTDNSAIDRSGNPLQYQFDDGSGGAMKNVARRIRIQASEPYVVVARFSISNHDVDFGIRSGER